MTDWQRLLELVELKVKADGCSGCAFVGTEEWDMPCAKCKRNSKDYWRPNIERKEG